MNPIEDKMKRKRLKVTSACRECRRKKTKCNGVYPCAGCLKAGVECQYTFNQKPGTSMSIIRERLNNNVHFISQPLPKEPDLEEHIKNIETRLSIVENVLREMLDHQLAPIKKVPAIRDLLNED